jgi:aspartyl-tRNA(Asn)/glutamyl-tRNA(Gln) amidotransferase subunit A
VPTIGTVAPSRTVGERDLRPTILRFTEPFNVLGWPALALPCGPAEAGPPASLSLVARSGRDGLVLGAGLALEAALQGC